MFKGKWKQRVKIPKSMKSDCLNITLENYEYKSSIECVWPDYNWSCPVFYQIKDKVKQKKNDYD